MRLLSLGVLVMVGCGVPDVHDAPATSRTVGDWTLLHSIPLSGAQSPHLQPGGENVVVTTASAVWRGPLTGGLLPLATVTGPGPTAIGPDGQLFVSRPGAGDILRIEPDGTVTSWVDAFTDADDDPVGMAFAPPGYTGPVLTPGEGVVVDRGATGPDGVWTFDPALADVPPTRVVSDDSDLRDAVDIAVTSDAIFLIDPREGSSGRLYELLAEDVLANRLLMATPNEPTGIAWDPVGECLMVPDAATGAIHAVDATGPGSQIVTVLPGGSYPATTRANIDVSADGVLMVVANDDAVHVFGRCSSPSAADDCDGDGIADACTRVTEPGSDCDGDGVLDVCQGVAPEEDCDDDGIVDDCPLCLDLDVALVTDSTTAQSLCDAVPGLTTRLATRGIEATLHVFAPSADDADCASPLSGRPLPDGAPAGLTDLSSCPQPGTAWLHTTALAASAAFADAPIRRRVVVPVVSGQPSCVPVSDTVAARSWVIDIARSYNAAIHPVVVSPTPLTSASELASATGGRVTTASPSQRLLGAYDAIALRCASADDCDGNAILDACQTAEPGLTDCDCDGQYDGCSPLGDPLCSDIDADGIGLTCDTCVDTDADGAGDPDQDRSGCALPGPDVCPDTPNPDQQDTDADGIGDACDACTDPDGDGVAIDPGCPVADVDNCPDTANPDQADADGDGFGDACDICTDSDGDGAADTADGGCARTDNCPTIANPDQTDSDDDGLGDACDDCLDADFDGFGVGDGCPLTGDDCDDTRASVNPAARETPYDGIDQDCSGADACDLDGDGADAVVCGGLDCDDTDPDIGPTMVERDGDGIDNDCDPSNDIQGCACTATGSGAPWFALLFVTAWIRTRRATRRGSW